LLQNLDSMGCSFPLRVQEKCCPPINTDNDVVVGTYTGSGKTLAFLVPLIQRLLEAPEEHNLLRVIIVAPGRELASQITSVARILLTNTPLKVVLAIGGTTFSRNIADLRKKKPTIIVGTPGRMAELVVGTTGNRGGGRLKVSDVQSIVLDEFDALLQYKAHREPTRALMSFLRRRHRDSLQSIMCSATATDMISSEEFAKKTKEYKDYLRSDDRVSTVLADDEDQLVTAGRTRVSRTVMHGVLHVPRKQLMLDTLRRILHTDPMPHQALIFCDSSRSVDLLVQRLAEISIIAAPLHGGMGQDKTDRAEVSKALREGTVGLVVSTELAARGIDAPLLTHVINMDLPTDASHYAHRAGRCGRGGRPGVVLNLTGDAKERHVPRKLTDALGVPLYNVRAHAGKLQLIVDDHDERNKEDEKEKGAVLE